MLCSVGIVVWLGCWCIELRICGFVELWNYEVVELYRF